MKWSDGFGGGSTRAVLCPNCKKLEQVVDIVKEIHRLWMESPDWNQTDEGTRYLIRLFELGMK